jgi:murein DD-endopeptidase MepM/ murein hydrolase activator NlpD
MASEITWPLLSNVIRGRSVSNTFGMVRHYADGSPKPHQGWDFEAPVGTPAYAIADGEVVFVENSGAYGIQLCLAFRFHGQERYAFYAHLQHVYVKNKESVKLNDLIATCGKTGNAWNLPAKEDHLHFEIRTQAHCGLGLGGRISPFSVYGICPLHSPVAG